MSIATGFDLAPFVTPDELRAALAEPGLPDDQAAWLAEWASAAVRAEVSQMVNVVQDDVVVLDGSGSGVILLPELEVRAVRRVRLHDQELEERVGYTWNRSGCLWRLRGPGWRYQPLTGWRRQLGRWTSWPRAVEVTYDHGWSPPSPQWDAARTVALEVAGRTFRNPGMLQSERIGDWSRAYVPRGGRAELTDVEKRTLDPLRRGR